LIHLGSTQIEPISKEINRIDVQLKNVRDFLQLPNHQKKTLSSQLKEAGNMIELLSTRVAEISSEMNRFSVRVEANQENVQQFGSLS
jgi:predicted  nucleic acid-binding Zn-ribbon protein